MAWQGCPCIFLHSGATGSKRNFEKEMQRAFRQREWAAKHPRPFRGGSVAGEGDDLSCTGIAQHGGSCFLPSMKIPQSSPHPGWRHMDSLKSLKRLMDLNRW